MEDQLIAFGTFEIAKSKGFDEYTTRKGVIVLPTQSLLQKWLREKHNLIVEVIFNSESELWEFDCFYPDSLDKAVTYYSDIFEFKTYEEALEAGLKQGLKLI